MKRSPLFLAFSGVELVRYFALVYAVRTFSEAAPQAGPALRIASAPNALFAAAFLFLGLDAERYAGFKPLLAVGKALCLFGGLVALPGMLRLGAAAQAESVAAYVFVGIAAWDALSAVPLLIPAVERGRPEPPTQSIPPSSEPERVEPD